MMEKIKKAIGNFLQKLRIIFNKEASLVIEQEFGGGLLGIGESEKDYIFGSSATAEMELARRGVINRQVRYEYNQGAQYETRNWCTIYSAITELSWLMDYEFTQDEINEIGRGMIFEGKLNPNEGAYLHDAIDTVRNWWNEKFPNKKVSSYRISYSDKELRHILTHINPRLTQIGYRTSMDLYKEIQTTGVAGKKDYKKIGGHAVSQWGLSTINNYKGERIGGKLYRNRFSFTFINDLIKNGVIFDNGYMFLKA